MEVYKHILIATDFTEFSKKAADRAVNLARLCNAELTLLHVVEQYQQFLSYISVEWIPPEDMEPWKSATGHSQKQLARLAKHIDYSKTKILTRVTKESAKHEIVRIAKEISADLIVTGAHGHSGLRKLLGSIAEGVVHLAPCEVLVVRSHPTNGN